MRAVLNDRLNLEHESGCDPRRPRGSAPDGTGGLSDMASEFQVPEGMVGVVATTSLNLSEISREMLRVTETLKSNGSLTREWTNLLEAVASAEDAWIRL